MAEILTVLTVLSFFICAIALGVAIWQPVRSVALVVAATSGGCGLALYFALKTVVGNI